MIDMVLLATCENDMYAYANLLWDAYQKRPDGKEFRLACIMHDGTWSTPAEIKPWSHRGLFRYLFISEHVIDTAEEEWEQFSDRKYHDEHADSYYEYIKMDTFYPVVDFSSFLVPKEQNPPVGLSKAIIQGKLEQKRRDYNGTFMDLLGSLAENPYVWGYLPLDAGNASAVYEPDPNSKIPPFELHLLGSYRSIVPPATLVNILYFHIDLNSRQFYDVLGSMDVVLPVFSDKKYYGKLASSTAHTAVQCNVPLLATNRIMRHYRYLDETVTIVRPQAISDIQALRALRTGERPKMATTNSELVKDMDRMLGAGWRRSTAAFDAFKQQLWDKNEQLFLSLLDGE